MKRTLQEVNQIENTRGRTRASTKKFLDQLNVSVINVKTKSEFFEISVKVDDDEVELKVKDDSLEVICNIKSCKEICKHESILEQWWELKGRDMEAGNLKRIKLESKENVAAKLKIKKKVTKPLPKHLENSVADEELMVQNFANQFVGKDFKHFLKFSSDYMAKDLKLLSEAEELTMEQADTDAWHNLRLGRLTASRLYESTRCTMMNGCLTERIMNVMKGGFSWAMKRGTILEDDVFEVVKKEFPSLKKCGLILNHKYPFFGASPDGIADNFVLEIKCPYTPKTYATYIDKNKLSKKYFTQIQLQMHLAHKKKALLAVADVDFENSKKIKKIWIPYDKKYTEEMLAEGLEFYEEAIFPALMKRAARRYQ